MTKEDKDLLLQYLCMALPYGVKCQTKNGIGTLISVECSFGEKLVYVDFGCSEAEEYDLNDGDTVKPYLRPVSSMTDEEKSQMTHDCYIISLDFEHRTTDMVALWNTPRVISWLLEHHFDFMNLIPKGLASEAHKDIYEIQN